MYTTSQLLLKGAESAWAISPSLKHKLLLCCYKLEMINVPMQQHQSIYNHLSHSNQTIIGSIFDGGVPVPCQTALVQTYCHIFGRTSEPFVCELQFHS